MLTPPSSALSVGVNDGTKTTPEAEIWVLGSHGHVRIT